MRLRHMVRIGPKSKEIRGLGAADKVTFAPMEALADGLGGLDLSLTKPLGDVAGRSYNYFAEGDVLLAKVTPCFENGKKAVAHGLRNGVGFATSEVYVLRPSQDKIDIRFLRYLLSSEEFRAEGMKSMTGAGGLRRVSENGVLNFRPKVDDIESQKKIADFLDHETDQIDQLIEKKRRLVGLMAEKEKGDISRLVMKGLHSDSECRESGLWWRGNVPRHWTESRLKAHFRMQKRQGFQSLTVLSVYRELGVIVKSSRDDNFNRTPQDLSKYQLVEPGDLVVNKMKAWQGSLGISAFEGITSPDYVVMIPTAEHDPGYMHHLLRARPMPTVYELISNGIRTDQWRMEPDRFLSLPLFLPPVSEQRQIAGEVDRRLKVLRGITEAVNMSIERLREIRSALITAAVAGQIDVTAWGKRGEMDRRLDRIAEEMASGVQEGPTGARA